MPYRSVPSVVATAALSLFVAAFAVPAAAADAPVPAAAPAPVDVGAFLRRNTYDDVKISPRGDYFAATVPLEDRTVLVVLRRSDMTPTAKIEGGRNSVVHGVWWANDERVVVALAEKIGARQQPYATGELYAVNADGSRAISLTGPAQYTFASMHDALRDDDRNVLISAYPWGDKSKPLLEKLDIYTGQRSPVAAAPVPDADFVVDRAGVARFAVGAGNDNASRLYYREKEGGEWRLINDENASGVVEIPLGFSEDGRIAYLQAERPGKPDAIVRWDPATGTRTEVLSDPTVDPYAVLYDAGGSPIGARFMHARLTTRFFDDAHPLAKRYRQFEKAFPNDAVFITSGTRDEQLLLLQVGSDRNPGDFYIFDATAKKVLPLAARRLWLDPAKMAATRGVSFAARDGLQVHGYLTLPPAADAGKPRAMVLLPHGGPFGVFDRWGFDEEVQMLAQAGYAVLQVNYRGSGNYGRDFHEAGAGEWGRKLQFDLTDATKWAIAENIADPARICIYGASYGAYAALMGAASEPSLYRCAAGYVGVYDMTEHHRELSDNNAADRLWAQQWLGPRERMTAISVPPLAGRIKAAVFLAAGGEDRITPISHSEKMEKALVKAGVPVETLYYADEGHGFYKEEHRRAYYTRLLGFLARHLGGAPAK